MKKLFRNAGMVALCAALFLTAACGGKKEAKDEGKAPQKEEVTKDQGGKEYKDRAGMREQVTEWNECKNVALTETNGDVALYGENGYYNENIPEDMNNAIVKLNEEGEEITDIQLTEKGSWLVVSGINHLQFNSLPGSLEEMLRKYNDDGETINSASFNDKGDWIVITDERYAASDAKIGDKLEEGENEYGELWAACVNDEGWIAVYERGYVYDGKIPETLLKKLDNIQLNTYRVKFSGNSWFLADKDGNFEYYM